MANWTTQKVWQNYELDNHACSCPGPRSDLYPQAAGQISRSRALEYLQNGALVVDVRSPGEFSSGHLSKALNIPLGEIESALPRRVKDKQQVLLLHCQSGMRSAMAARKLKTLGYVNVFNLGSYSRAARIVGK